MATRPFVVASQGIRLHACSLRYNGRYAEPDRYEAEAVFVVYCSGPHCNGADKAALRLAALGRPVKKMIGGITGWLDEGFELAAVK